VLRRPRGAVEAAAGPWAVSTGADFAVFEPPELPDDDREELPALVESGGLLAVAEDEAGCACLGSILNLCWIPLRAARAEEEL